MKILNDTEDVTLVSVVFFFFLSFRSDVGIDHICKTYLRLTQIEHQLWCSMKVKLCSQSPLYQLLCTPAHISIIGKSSTGCSI